MGYSGAPPSAVQHLAHTLAPLTGQIFGLQQEEMEAFLYFADKDKKTAVYTAELYLTYKREYDSYSPKKNYDWDFEGSVFFATTILTTIGYGTFAPTTDSAKLLLAIVTIPGIGLFGYALSQVATLTLLVVGQVQ